MNREKGNHIKQLMKGQKILLGPGMVLMKGYISSDDQISFVRSCRDLGIGSGGFYQPGKLPLQMMMCLGKHWDPDSHMYTELRPFDKSKPPRIPEKFHEMVRKAIHDSNEGGSDEAKVVSSMSPDICIVNFYTKTYTLGLHHQAIDKGEKSLKKGVQPVVSFSIGDSAEFLYGETQAVDEADKVILESGDALIYGGESRYIYHGVTSILPDTAPTSLIEATNMCAGHLNLTFRMPKEDDNDNDNARRSHPVFDICPKRVGFVDPRTDWKPKIHGSMENASFSQNDKSSVPKESRFNDAAFDVNYLKLTLNALDDYGGSKKVKEYGDKSQKDDDDDDYGKSNSKIKYTDDDIRLQPKYKLKIGDGYLDSVYGKSYSKIKHTYVDPRTDCKPKAKIDGYSASFSQNNKSSVPGESIFDDADAAFDANNRKQLTLNALNDYSGFKKVKQYGDKSQKDDDNERLKHHVFDI